MIVLRLVPALTLFLLLAGQFILLPGQVYAWCCPCGTECSVLNLGSWFCKCPGKTPECPYCQKSDSATFQAKSLTGSGMSDVGGVPGSVSSTVTKQDFTGLFIELTRGGKCAGNKLALRLLANAGEDLKIEPVSFDENGVRDQTLAFQITTEEEK